MALNFECNNTGELSDVAIKKGKISDGNSPSLHFKVKCIAPKSILKPLLGGDNTNTFHRRNADKDIMFTGIKQILSVAKFTNHFIEFAGAEIKECRLSDFKLKPLIDEEVDLSFKVCVLEPSDEVIHDVKSRLTGTGHLKVSGLDLVDEIEDEPEGDDEQVD